MFNTNFKTSSFYKYAQNYEGFDMQHVGNYSAHELHQRPLKLWFPSLVYWLVNQLALKQYRWIDGGGIRGSSPLLDFRKHKNEHRRFLFLPLRNLLTLRNVLLSLMIFSMCAACSTSLQHPEDSFWSVS